MSGATKKGFGKRLREAREEAGYNPRRLFAEAVGVDLRTIQRWEGGENLPRDAEAKLTLIASLVAREALWLEKGIGPKTGPQQSLPEVEEYLRTHEVAHDVAAALRKQPFEELLMPHPTVKDLEQLCFLLEMTIAPKRQRSDGDKSG